PGRPALPAPAGSTDLFFGGWPPAARAAHPIDGLVLKRDRQFLTAATNGLLVDTSDLKQQPIGAMPEALRLHRQIPASLSFVQSTQQQVHVAVVCPIRVRRSRLAARALAGVHRPGHVHLPRHLPYSRTSLLRKRAPKPELVLLRRLSLRFKPGGRV